MDKSVIKNFAVWARVKLMEDIRTRLGLLGITEDGIASPLPASTGEVKYFDIGADHPVSIKGVAIRQRGQIADQIRKAGKESNYKLAFQNFVESAAYDWFNRLVAIRYMEVNEYAPLDVRLLSSVEAGKQDPDLVSSPFDGSLEFTESETQQILAWKEQHDNSRLFRFLLFKMCNQLHEVLPGIFEAKDDASELLMRQSFIDKDGIIHHLVTDIPEEDWKDQVQIIGWIYQYYNSELKSEVFAKKSKVTKDELPAVTQLFTPDWIVRYMVENSLGRLWIEHLRGLNPDVDEKETAEKFGWKYYLPEAKQDPEVEQELAKIREEYATLKPEDLSCLDPCMGSGHILSYFFDVLVQIYTSVGYSERDAAKAILENNIYGLDIDDRAYQLAYFSVMMKARQYNRRILTSGIKAHVYSIQESNGITKEQLRELGVNLTPEEKAVALLQAEKLVDLFHDAKEYGSILDIPEMDWDLLRRFAAPDESAGQMSLNWNQTASERLIQLINQGQVMAKKYWVTCTNPPYAAVSGLDVTVSEYVKEHYPDSKSDLFAVFIEKCNKLLNVHGYLAMITQHAWMFQSSFENLRKKVLRKTIVNMAHLGARAFEEIGGEVVQTTSFVRVNGFIKNYRGTYCRLIKPTTQLGKENMFLACENRYKTDQSYFSRIPGNPVAYWVSQALFRLFVDSPSIKAYGKSLQGTVTGDNERFMRLWYEVGLEKFSIFSSSTTAKWFPYCKGGEFRRWYGNVVHVINWENDGYAIKNFRDGAGKLRSRPQNTNFFFRKGITWSSLTGGLFGGRYLPANSTFSDIGPLLVLNNDKYINLVLAYVNSKVFQEILDICCAGLHYQNGIIAGLPCVDSKYNNDKVNNLTNECISISQADWDTFEISWNFRSNPLVPSKNKKLEQHSPQFISSDVENASLLTWHYENWKQTCDERFEQLKADEEDLNKFFIEIFDLQDELSPEEDISNVTVHKADLCHDIRSLISYAIGCIFGRYSLDKEGLIYAGGDWKSVQDDYKTFLPDQDNVIPITDQKYLDDDVVERICEFLTVVYGADTLEENLDFIAKALGNKGLTSREVIRNYMLDDFFKDHCKTYSVTGSGKRPIYWLFDSGKQNAFKALVYMHRWDADTTGRVLLYAQQIQQKYETEIRAIDMMLDHITDSRQASNEEKRREHLKKQLDELVDYEERLEHMANERIAIDLDDGVKVNYEKVQTDRNGKKFQILAPIK